MTGPLYLDDFPLGRVFTGGPLTVSEAEIIAFGRQFDPQVFHTDPAGAAAHPIFQGLAASGWHTAGLSMRMIVAALGPLAWGMVGGEAQLSWPRPIRPGDSLRVTSEVIEAAPSRSRPDRGSVVMRSLTLNQHDEVVQSFTGRLLMPRRPAAG